MKTQILMSYENPEGYKLEELLAIIAQDIAIKNAKIDPNDGETDQLVLSNNMVIITLLEQAAGIQNESMVAMGSIGQDKGPYVNEPRIGAAIDEPRVEVDSLDGGEHMEHAVITEGVTETVEDLEPVKLRGATASVVTCDEASYVEGAEQLGVAVAQPDYVMDVPLSADGSDIMMPVDESEGEDLEDLDGIE